MQTTASLNQNAKPQGAIRQQDLQPLTVPETDSGYRTDIVFGPRYASCSRHYQKRGRIQSKRVVSVDLSVPRCTGHFRFSWKARYRGSRDLWRRGWVQGDVHCAQLSDREEAVDSTGHFLRWSASGGFRAFLSWRSRSVRHRLAVWVMELTCATGFSTRTAPLLSLIGVLETTSDHSVRG